jgi:hypothetical protein
MGDLYSLATGKRIKRKPQHEAEVEQGLLSHRETKQNLKQRRVDLGRLGMQDPEGQVGYADVKGNVRDVAQHHDETIKMIEAQNKGDRVVKKAQDKGLYQSVPETRYGRVHHEDRAIADMNKPPVKGLIEESGGLKNMVKTPATKFAIKERVKQLSYNRLSKRLPKVFGTIGTAYNIGAAAPAVRAAKKEGNFVDRLTVFSEEYMGLPSMRKPGKPRKKDLEI